MFRKQNRFINQETINGDFIEKCWFDNRFHDKKWG